MSPFFPGRWGAHCDCELPGSFLRLWDPPLVATILEVAAKKLPKKLCAIPPFIFGREQRGTPSTTGLSVDTPRRPFVITETCEMQMSPLSSAPGAPQSSGLTQLKNPLNGPLEEGLVHGWVGLSGKQRYGENNSQSLDRSYFQKNMPGAPPSNFREGRS